MGIGSYYLGKMGVAEGLVDFCRSLTYEDLPLEVITKVKELALDFIGVTARGVLHGFVKGCLQDGGGDGEAPRGGGFDRG